MISRRALGVAGRWGRLAWRLDRPIQFSAQSPDELQRTWSTILEKLEHLSSKLSSNVDDHVSRLGLSQDLGEYLLRKLDSLDKKIASQDEQISQERFSRARLYEQIASHYEQIASHYEQENFSRARLSEQIASQDEKIKMQTSYHMEWCQRDLSLLAAEILKWCIGMRGTTGEDGWHFYATRNQREVKIGAQVFFQEVEDFKDFSRLVILDRNHQVHFGSLKLLDDRVEIAQRYIRDFESYLCVLRPKEVEVTTKTIKKEDVVTADDVVAPKEKHVEEEQEQEQEIEKDGEVGVSARRRPRRET